jgi:SAM-dependent methyltransferase
VQFNIWEHSAVVRDLYARRAQGQAPEMDAHAQAVEILAPNLLANEGNTSVLDAGCGSGYLYHSFRTRNLDVEYHGLDCSPGLIDLGRRFLPDFGLPAERLEVGLIENIQERYDVVVCLNTLSWLPDWRLPLDRLCAAARRFLLIRTNLGPAGRVRWEIDGYLEEGYNHLRAYWNVYPEAAVRDFLATEGFEAQVIVDRRTGSLMETVVGKPYWWKFIYARRTA